MARHRILVVDDEADIRSIVREALEASGYGVRAAALYLPDSVLLDVMTPGMGWLGRAYERLRAKPVDSRAPIVFLTANRSTSRNRWRASESTSVR